jgi:hypothetical protein
MLDASHFPWLLVVALVAAGLIYGWWAHFHARFTTVSRGVLYHSAAMPTQKLARFIRRKNIATVFDFRSGQDSAVKIESEALVRLGVRHLHLPTGIAPQRSEIDTFIRAIGIEVAAGRRVLMHCEDGEGRAVMFAALYRIHFEVWSPQDAYLATARLPDGLRFLNRLVPRIGCLSPRNVKTRLILDYRVSP